jgi:hypothetical protein
MGFTLGDEETLREAATSLENTLWETDYRRHDNLAVLTCSYQDKICVATTPELANYISLCSPRDILGLLDELDRVRAEILALKNEVTNEQS